ncbi:hypothetical protein [Plantactinospora endophytica]|nr:hypothetical protein [Plantactinospora endophytica]
MAARGWGASVATAIGVAAGAGAAQLGFGYGLGIIAWLPSGDGNSEAAWVASLTWAAWIAATSTVAGAICAHRLSGGGRRSATGRAGGPPPTLATFLWRAVLAVSSAIGALVTVVLVAVPARAAVRVDGPSPQTVAAGYAVLGVLLGLLMAIWAISSPAVAGNVLGTVCWLWALAVIAVVDGVLSGQGLASAQLGVWQLTSDGERFWFREYFYWPGAALSLGSALVIGALAARSAARRPVSRVGAAVSGIGGPLLVAVAYFLAAPRLVGIRPEQVSAHLMAPYAVVAGLAGSALMAALAQRSEALARHAEEIAARHAEELAARSGSSPSEPTAPGGAPTGDSGPTTGSGSAKGRVGSGSAKGQVGGGSGKEAVGGGPDDRDRSAGSTGVAAGGDGDRTQDADQAGEAGAGPAEGAATRRAGGAGRSGRMPGQPKSGSRRASTDADISGVRSTAGSTRLLDSGSEVGSAPDTAEPDAGTDGSPPAGPEESAEPATEGRSKGRLGRLGRRSR